MCLGIDYRTAGAWNARAKWSGLNSAMLSYVNVILTGATTTAVLNDIRLPVILNTCEVVICGLLSAYLICTDQVLIPCLHKKAVRALNHG